MFNLTINPLLLLNPLPPTTILTTNPSAFNVTLCVAIATKYFGILKILRSADHVLYHINHLLLYVYQFLFIVMKTVLHYRKFLF